MATQAEEKIREAISLLIMEQNCFFFSCIILRLKRIVNEVIETAGVDDKSLYYCTKFVLSRTTNQLKSLLAHESLHIALGHCWRRNERNPILWNVAADYVINLILKDTGLEMPSEKALLDEKYRGMSTEEIYEKLFKEAQKMGGDVDKNIKKMFGGSNDPGQSGGVLDAENIGSDEAQQSQAEWKAAIKAAAKVAKGSMPAELERMIGEMLYPPIPWGIVLRDFIQRHARNDYDWSRANRRYVHYGYTLPSLLSEELPEIVVVNDTSGSRDQTDINEFAGGCSDILQHYKTTIRVIHCDAKVHKEEVYSSEELPLQLHPSGGGGTDFRPAFDYVEEKGYTPACLIYFTDLWGDFPSKAPDYPVLWVTKNKNDLVPFGEKVIF